MILKLLQNNSQKETEVQITYSVMDKTVNRIISLVKSVDKQLECYSGNTVKMVNVSDVYYIESIDKKTIVFCDNENFSSKNRLYQIYEKLSGSGFVQISKYCIVNINKLEKIKTLANSHLEAVLSNGKCLYVTRKYLTGIKRLLKEED